MLPSNFPDFIRGDNVFQSLIDKIVIGFSDIGKALEGANSSLPSWIQNLGLALLSILIPLAIAILTDLIQKKRSEATLYELDLQVILDHVFKIKPLIGFSVLIFLPFLRSGSYSDSYCIHHRSARHVCHTGSEHCCKKG